MANELPILDSGQQFWWFLMPIICRSGAWCRRRAYFGLIIKNNAKKPPLTKSPLSIFSFSNYSGSLPAVVSLWKSGQAFHSLVGKQPWKKDLFFSTVTIQPLHSPSLSPFLTPAPPVFDWSGDAGAFAAVFFSWVFFGRHSTTLGGEIIRVGRILRCIVEAPACWPPHRPPHAVAPDMEPAPASATTRARSVPRHTIPYHTMA